MDLPGTDLEYTENYRTIQYSKAIREDDKMIALQ
jgi:hypothetical protein